MRDNGLRLLLVGYESGNQQILDNIKKGIRLEEAREFTRQLPRSWGSPFTAPSSSACRERRRRRSGRRSSLRRRWTRFRSR